MKALEKDRNRRYATANDLARDLERYLAGEPVEAGPPSAGVPAAEVRPQAPRGPGDGWGLRDGAGGGHGRQHLAGHPCYPRGSPCHTGSGRDEDRARILRRQGVSGPATAGQGGRGSEVTLRAALDAAESGIASRFAAQPKVEASIRDALGRTYFRLGEFDSAARQHELAIGLRVAELSHDHPDTLNSMNNLAVAYRRGGHSREAISILEKVLAARRKTLGPEHRDTLMAMGDLAVACQEEPGRLAEAVELLERQVTLSTKFLGLDDAQTLVAMNNLAVVYKRSGRIQNALPLYTKVLDVRCAKLRPDHPDVLNSMNNLAAAYQVTGRIPEAIELFQSVLERRKVVLSPDNPETLTSMGNLALAYLDTARPGEAIDLYKQALASRRVKLRPGHPDTLRTMNNLGAAYLKANRWVDAEPVLRECLELRGKTKSNVWLRFHTKSQLGARWPARGNLPRPSRCWSGATKVWLPTRPRFRLCTRKTSPLPRSGSCRFTRLGVSPRRPGSGGKS